MGRRLRSHAPDSGHYGVASDRGADRAAAMTTLIMTAKLNDVDPLAWLADVLARIADIPQPRLTELLPWNWQSPTSHPAAAQAA
jgi:transposase